MKCTIPEISWHNREPVLSVDIYPKSDSIYRLATGGGDCHVVLWDLNLTDNGSVKQEVFSDLTRHQKAVNCVRWSNGGQYLASADDDANIIVWQQKCDTENGDKEMWGVYKVLRGHKEDVYDLCWSIGDSKLISGSIDNTAILWDITKGKLDHILTDHKGFVQGVCWDPKNQLIASISTDKICRVFDTTGKQIKARINKGKLSVPENHVLYNKEVKFFHDDTFKSFFRRLQFTPDGSLLIVPSGYIEADGCKPLNATLIFTLDNWGCPAAILPLTKQSSTVVRCCPLLFELRDDGPDPFIKLPYRMVFAVGTDHDIILYDTQQIFPFARFQDIHYTRLTDLTWSQDGLLLIGSSTDGFCSVITFDVGELGVAFVNRRAGSDVEEYLLEVSSCKDENVDTTNKEESKKAPSFLVQWAQNTSKKDRVSNKEVVTSTTNEPNAETPTRIEKKQPRRIVPIKIGEVESKMSLKTKTQPTPRTATPVEEPATKKPKLEDDQAEDFNRASNDIKEFFCRLPKFKSDPSTGAHSDAKPIAVRRKPKDAPPEQKRDEPKTPVRKKLEAKDTNKKNTLHNFLRSGEKRKTKTDGEGPLIDLTLEENQAQEAWAEAAKEVVVPTEKSGPTRDDDDRTEDFCLQLEDSRSAEEESRIVRRDDSSEAATAKTPRRIPLITLASPKRVV
ncbi:chromatin assembly factor 1 subunit B [Cylas formicarius]|uniref:chromatin assembly factor 1 subunit B n=1 Tax=Cylas formicarius TaxID=197179 RepID=UPI00295857A1|nr:chromatin assembly factor 1 subunit B [Cylas formicarius]